MTARDRIALAVLGAAALLAAFWFLVLAPKREESQKLTDQVAQAHQRLETANQQIAAATAARKRYPEDYSTVARLGKAVPADDDVPSLVYQLDSAAKHTRIDFRSIKLQSTGASTPTPAATPPAAAVASANGTPPAAGSTPPAAGSTPTPTPTPAAAPAVAPGLPPGSAVGAAGFPTMPFTFLFEGNFFDMEHFFFALNKFTGVAKQQVTVRGRLLTIDGFALDASRRGFPRVEANVTATAYILPAEQGLTAGATPQAPATGTPAATSTASPAPAPAAATSVGGAR